MCLQWFPLPEIICQSSNTKTRCVYRTVATRLWSMVTVCTYNLRRVSPSGPSFFLELLTFAGRTQNTEFLRGLARNAISINHDILYVFC